MLPKNAMGNNGNNCSEDRKKTSQKWPDLHHFWNYGHTMLKHNMEIYMDHILVMINKCVELEKNMVYGMFYKYLNR